MDTQPSNQLPRPDGGSIPLAPPVGADEIGRLGSYRVLKELGRGGMGAVYLAEDTVLGRRVALKVMLPGFAAQDAARARFVREARAVAALKHDHVVTVYQAGEENGVPFLAMELLAGKTLDDWLRPDRRATPTQVLTIGRQVAEGLAAAHAAGLVHRDVKPANVWLEAPKGRVKLLDFGLARGAGGGDPGLTGAGDILGTPAYMAPEQARGQPVDHRCDLFSLGCVLYRMATGRLPFQGDTAYAVIVAVVSERPAAPRDANPGVPPELESLILALLEKDPVRRPQSAAAVLAEMKRVAAVLTPDRPIPLPPDREPAGGQEVTTAWRDDDPPPGRGSRRLLVGGVAGVAALALVLVVVLGRGQDATPDPAPPDPAPKAQAAEPTKKDDTLAGGGSQAPQLSAAGKWDLDPLERAKASVLWLHPDGRVTRDDGFAGTWIQSGRKVGLAGKNTKAKSPELKLKTLLDPDGKVLRVVSPKGDVDVWHRR